MLHARDIRPHAAKRERALGTAPCPARASRNMRYLIPPHIVSYIIFVAWYIHLCKCMHAYARTQVILIYDYSDYHVIII